MENENTNILDKEVGTKEIETLKPEDVVVKGTNIQPVKKKNSEEVIGQKVVLLCKHPQRDELIKISQLKHLVGEKVKVTTLWVRLDEDDKIQKGSMLDLLLQKAKIKKLSEIQEVTLSTDIDTDGYLCIKAY